MKESGMSPWYISPIFRSKCVLSGLPEKWLIITPNGGREKRVNICWRFCGEVWGDVDAMNKEGRMVIVLTWYQTKVINVDKQQSSNPGLIRQKGKVKAGYSDFHENPSSDNKSVSHSTKIKMYFLSLMFPVIKCLWKFSSHLVNGKLGGS